jgi:hypothetical protein
VDLPRPLIVVALLLALAPPAPAAPGTGSGGTPAQPLRQGPGGGALAPDRSGTSSTSEPGTGGAPVAEAAREKPRATPPWGEEPRERGWAPYPTADEPPADAAPASAAEVRSVAGVEASGAQSEPAGGERAAGGSLPWTGLEIAALAAIGLGVLTLGAALRPRRRERTRAFR